MRHVSDRDLAATFPGNAGSRRRDRMRTLPDALVSGTLAGIASAAIGTLAARAQGQAPAALLNAVSHVLWGERAARQDAASARYTATGFVINHAASIFWAACYEALRRRAPRGPAGALASAAATAALAYVVDYHLMPRRLTPGYELRLKGPQMAIIYAAIALSLPLRELLRRQR
jgi:hypothetical protein